MRLAMVWVEFKPADNYTLLYREVSPNIMVIKPRMMRLTTEDSLGDPLYLKNTSEP
jgi:hypothetical protein